MQNKVLNEVTIDQMDDLIKAVKGGSSGFDTDGSLPELADGEVTDPLMAVGNDGKAKKLGVKTLFGKHNIRGSGNIDLYKHYITITIPYDVGDGSYNFYLHCEFYSSNSLICDSLTDLKTILGNTFIIAVYGSYTKPAGTIGTLVGCYMSNTNVGFVCIVGSTISYKVISIANCSFNDTVTTI